MAKSYLDSDGLLYLWGKIKNYVTGKVPDPYTSNPAMNGTASAGSSSNYAKGDHVHPSDTSKVDVVSGKGLSTNDFTTALKDKLDGIASGAEVNVQVDWSVSDSSSDAYIKNKPTIPSTAADVSAIPTSAKGAASGVCPLNASSKIDSSYLPSYVDDVIEAYPISGATELSASWLSVTSGGTALTPESGKIYILMAASTNYDVNMQFRWSGTTYVALSSGGVSAITNAEIDTIVAS